MKKLLSVFVFIISISSISCQDISDWNGTFSGELHLNLSIPHGFGNMSWPNGKSYSGQWYMGTPNGNGILNIPPRDIYE